MTFDNYSCEGQMNIFDLMNDAKPLQITKPIRLIELFAGIGSQYMALKRIGANVIHHKAIEFDKYAVSSYNAIHGTNFSTSDIREVGGVDLGITDTDKYCYIMTYSFPCFTGDTLVLTKDGYKPIKEIKSENDMVLTHKNSYSDVLAHKSTGIKDIWEVKGMGIDSIRCTENHKFYVREMYRTYPRIDNGKRANIRKFRSPEWIECKNLTKRHYLGIAINSNEVLPEWNGIDFKWSDGRKDRHKNQISGLMDHDDFWWVIGRYLGDGWCRSQGGLIICCDKNELKEITERLNSLEIKHSVTEERTVDKIHIPLKEFELFVKQFGYGADGKRIPGFVFDMPKAKIKSLVDGYLSADGSYTSGVYKITSVSRELIYGIAQLVAKAYQTPYRIYKNERPKKCVIEGRIVNQRDTYQLVWKVEKKKQDKAFYENGYIWFPIKSVTKTGKQEEVYDVTVDDAHSFTANGVIVHNCQDLSVAGKGAGMVKGSGTRSGLLWEVERLLKECKEYNGNLPQVLLMENVTQVHGKKNIADFKQWIDFLTSLGYTNVWQDLNAKDYGVAQNRNRCFMVSFLGNYTYQFPKPIPLTKTMKDYLEDEVDEKFYVNSDRAKELLDKLEVEGILERTNERTNHD